MQDDVSWKLSLLLDDELDASEAVVLLEQISQDAQLLDKWYGYQTIRQALRTGGGVRLQPEFIERVRVALADETLAPPAEAWPGQGRWVVKFKRFNFERWTMPLAVTALIALFMLLVGKQALFSTSGSAPHKAGWQVARHSQLEDYYLLVHSEDSLYLTGPQHMLGYARIVSHGGR